MITERLRILVSISEYYIPKWFDVFTPGAVDSRRRVKHFIVANAFVVEQ